MSNESSELLKIQVDANEDHQCGDSKSLLTSNKNDDGIMSLVDTKRRVDDNKPRKPRKRNKTNESVNVQGDDVLPLPSCSLPPSVTSEPLITQSNVKQNARDAQIELSASQKYVIDLIMQEKSVFFSGNKLVKL